MKLSIFPTTIFCGETASVKICYDIEEKDCKRICKYEIVYGNGRIDSEDICNVKFSSDIPGIAIIRGIRCDNTNSYAPICIIADNIIR